MTFVAIGAVRVNDQPVSLIRASSGCSCSARFAAIFIVRQTSLYQFQFPFVLYENIIVNVTIGTK